MVNSMLTSRVYERKNGMIKIALCDDENVILNQMEEILIDSARKNGVQIDIDVFHSGERLEMSILEKSQYDLVYLDIQMKCEEGITTARNIRDLDENLLLVLLSGHDKYVMELFQLGVFDFIKQPIQLDIFDKTFMAAYQKIYSKKVYFSFHYKNEVHKVLCSEILYFESKGRQIHINMKDGDIKCFNGKLNDIENYMSKGKIPFLRIHQSYLVNYHWIQTSSKTKVISSDGKKLPISEERQKAFQKEYVKLLGDEISEWIG